MGKRRVEVCSCGGGFVWMTKSRWSSKLHKFNLVRALVDRGGNLRECNVYTPHVCRPPSERQVARQEVAQRLRVLAKEIETASE